MSELNPCPFCGGEADEYEGDYGNGIYCMMCGAMVGEPIHLEYRTTKRVNIEEAIAAWNSRAERTCFADEVTHRDCKYSVNRGWRERTCECIVEYAKSPLDGKTIVLHRCSSCNELMRPHMNYCPNCGSKVVNS